MSLVLWATSYIKFNLREVIHKKKKKINLRETFDWMPIFNGDKGGQFGVNNFVGRNSKRIF